MSIKTTQKNVAAAGTPVQLAADYPIPVGIKTTIKAKLGNAGDIYLGGNSADAHKDSTSHYTLSAGNSVTLNIKNLNEVWIDAASSADGVELLFEGTNW
jgi:hypothetical protein